MKSNLRRDNRRLKKELQVLTVEMNFYKEELEVIE